MQLFFFLKSKRYEENVKLKLKCLEGLFKIRSCYPAPGGAPCTLSGSCCHHGDV